jgi:hypothetical protein
MGNIINKILFMPPRREVYIDNSVPLITKHGSTIQTKHIDNKAKFTFVLSHSNAEDIINVNKWATEKLLHYCHVNVFLYGT